jgi:thiol-disulfide isomerase/thioredoxin
MNKYEVYLLLFSALFFKCNSCGNEIVLPSDIPGIKKNAASVFVFLSPDCPLSRNYTLILKNLSAKYEKDKIVFYAVFPGKLYSRQEINTFINEYNLTLFPIFDEEKKLTTQLKASVTPEVFLVDDAGKIWYQGAIDNGYEEVGKKREVTTKNYLRDALEAFISGTPIKISKTKAVGCMIE